MSAGCDSLNAGCDSPSFINKDYARFLRIYIVDWKTFLTIFASVFIAELGDKTQLATMLFAADKDVSKFTVFFAASAALIFASALGVLAGSLLAEYINERYLHYVAGIGFITIGATTLELSCIGLWASLFLGYLISPVEGLLLFGVLIFLKSRFPPLAAQSFGLAC